jgi:glycosyltransferase involved in cell wall biosynthesis
LDSVVGQAYHDFEVVLCENDSPDRPEIRRIVQEYTEKAECTIRYFENEKNLGYDGNIRRLVQQARGRYVCFCGNDDLLAPGALAALAAAIERNPGVGVVLRTYATFEDRPDRIDQVYRYFPEERVFPPGAETIVTFFKRCVVIPGVTFDRLEALKWESEKFDGHTLYQIWLVANILVDCPGVYVPDVVALYRLGGTPDIGHSPAEKRGNYVPGIRTPESSLFMMRGFLEIARHVEDSRGVAVRDGIERDLANYSFGFIVIQRSKGLRVFWKYVLDLGRLGYGRHPMYWVYVAAATLVPQRLLWWAMGAVKRLIGRTPNIGGVYQGTSDLRSTGTPARVTKLGESA